MIYLVKYLLSKRDKKLVGLKVNFGHYSKQKKNKCKIV